MKNNPFNILGYAIGVFSIAILASIVAKKITSTESKDKKQAIYYGLGGVALTYGLIRIFHTKPAI